MGIRVQCANGHVLKVKDNLAGKTGLCPICRAIVRVPQPTVSEDEIVAMLDRPAARPAEESPASTPQNGERGSAPKRPLDDLPYRRKKACPHCNQPLSFAFAAYCPRCGTPLYAAKGKPPEVSDASET